MAIQMFEGFENDFTERWSVSGDAAVTASGRNGDAIRFDTGTVSGSGTAVSPLISIASGGTIIVGFAIYIDGITRISPNIVSARNSSGTIMWALDLNAGTLNFDGGTFDTAASAACSATTWHYVEVKVDMQNTGGSAIVKLDGVEVINVSGDVLDIADQECSYIYFYGEDGTDHNIDDVYVCDDTGTINNDFLGDCYVKQLLPSGQGNHADGVGSDGNSVDNYQLVDEDPASTADYVALNVIGDRESYTVANLGVGEIPLAARVSASTFDGNGSHSVDGFLRIGVTNYDASDAKNVGGAQLWKDFYWNSNPNTAVAWAEDDLDGIELGVRRTA